MYLLKHFLLFHAVLADPNRVFWTSSTSLRVVKKEGEEYMLPCLLTDPSATDISLRMDNGTTVPPGMNYTVHRHRGILIHNLQPGFNADYVCSARVNGVERTSKAFSVNVIQSKTEFMSVTVRHIMGSEARVFAVIKLYF